ncbi:hypothetical protein HERIO_2509 [Hepatospora eriocheir]|uniref:Uncharacterized protein n=1 Tax=Hepatospora eriocheir TaxID=1081669 RepID=A0A1X0Q6N3_9MICR|nr:hypothetical protein HERIO_2509 [Hepatospora eriocheir]
MNFEELIKILNKNDAFLTIMVEWVCYYQKISSNVYIVENPQSQGREKRSIVIAFSSVTDPVIKSCLFLKMPSFLMKRRIKAGLQYQLKR